uniref:UspA domain-containing protein n=1 Tax=Kalanchoe fedtschenkoi TaxID=63787 RepID=A0A7N1A8B7_KALFE
MAEVGEKRRKIMVAVDEGEESMYALSWCLKNVVCGESKDTVLLLYVKPPRAVFTSLDGSGYLFSADILATMERYGNEVAQCVLDKAKRVCEEYRNVKVETKVENGDPRDMICEMAHKLNVDVLVMGSHGYGMIKRAFLGSVSNHCAQNVKCPVLIVKKPASSPAAEN